jgi:sugar lactone lactonase YvrE
MLRMARVIGVVVAFVGCSHHDANTVVDGGGDIDAPPISDAAPGDAAASDAAPGNAAARPYGLELLAGDIGGSGNGDGVGATARFFLPYGSAVDSAGDVYVTDFINHVIRKITPAGVVTTFAGVVGVPGSTDGPLADARFNFPSGLAIDSADNIYVTERGNLTLRKITPGGVVTTLAGSPGMSGTIDGTGAAARFSGLNLVAVDGAGTVYLGDGYAIRKVTAAGVVTTLAGAVATFGSTDGTGTAARFQGPVGIAIDGAGDLYVADQINNTIRKVTAAGVVTTVAGAVGTPGGVDGTGTAAHFNEPTGVAIDSAGDLYIADRRNSTIRKLTAAGVVTTLAGTPLASGNADGTGTDARFNGPSSLAVDSTGNVYVVDTGNFTIRKITSAAVVTTFAGAPARPGNADGTGAAARFFGPSAAADNAGNVYVADVGNDTVRKVTSDGVVTTIAGVVGMEGSTDGTGAGARFHRPSAVVADRAGNVYVTDFFNDTIRRISPAGVVTTFAGAPGEAATIDGTGTEARFNLPNAVAIDSADNLYVIDGGSSAIRKVTPGGVTTTVVAPDARFSFFGIAVDSAGNMYCTDATNQVIDKVTPAGVVTVLAGTAGMPGSADGIGAAARFNQPVGIAVDSAGNVYVTDSRNATIRKIAPDGTTTTLAGTAGVVGIVLGATPRFAIPFGLAIDGDSLLITDANAVLVLRHGLSH